MNGGLYMERPKREKHLFGPSSRVHEMHPRPHIALFCLPTQGALLVNDRSYLHRSTNNPRINITPPLASSQTSPDSGK